MWPLVLHIKGPYCILILPLVETRHVKAYARLCKRSDCGNAVMADENLSSLLLDLPSMTGYGKLQCYSVNIVLTDYLHILKNESKTLLFIPFPLWKTYYSVCSSSSILSWLFIVIFYIFLFYITLCIFNLELAVNECEIILSYMLSIPSVICME